MLKEGLLSLFVLTLTGCASIGPAQIHTDRGAYNEIVRQTDYEQLLTNIVHISYVEPTSYLKVTNVTSSYSLMKGISATPSWTKSVESGVSDTLTRSASATPTISYSDNPTISYVPLGDAQFVMMLQKPISFTDVALLFNGGYDNLIFLARLLFDHVGVLENASSASSARVESIPEYKTFYHFLDILSQMKRNHALDIEATLFERQPGLMIIFSKRSVNSPEARELKQLLRIPLNSKSIVLMSYNVGVLKINRFGQLVQESDAGKIKNLVYVRMRSIYGVMTFLSHSVIIPEADKKAHLTAQFMGLDGYPYNWAPLMNGLMTIYSSDFEPYDAFVKVWTNHHWFYIKETDINSKTTFDILVRLMTLTAGLGTAGAQTSPVLTLPV